MTRDEFIKEIESSIKVSDAMSVGPTAIAERSRVEASTLRDVLRIALQLDSPPAMTWQDEPSEDGWHFVRQGTRKFRACRVLMIPGKGWHCDGAGGVRPLNGRRVCPITAPPALPKR